MEQICNALLRQELVNYFEFANAAEFLVKSGHLVAVDNDRYTISELGLKTAETFESGLPAAVRERAVGALKNILKLLRRQEENRVEIEKTSDLMSLKIFMPGKEECEAIRRRFLNDPTTLYKGVFALLTGDLDTVGQLLPSQENLFEE